MATESGLRASSGDAPNVDVLESCADAVVETVAVVELWARAGSESVIGDLALWRSVMQCVDPGTWNTAEELNSQATNVLLPAILKSATDPGGSGWLLTTVGMRKRAQRLRVLPMLSLVNREWHFTVRLWVESAALTVAQFHLAWKWRAPWMSSDRFVVEQFNAAMSVLSFTWQLVKPISERFRLLPLSELSGPELSILCAQLGRQWQLRGTVPIGAILHFCG